MTKMGRRKRSSEGGNTPSLPPSPNATSFPSKMFDRPGACAAGVRGRGEVGRKMDALEAGSAKACFTGLFRYGRGGERCPRPREETEPEKRKIPAGSLSFLPVLAKKLSFTDKSLLLKNISASSRTPCGGSGPSARDGYARPEAVRGKFDPKGGKAMSLGRACEPCGHRTQRDSPRAGGARGRPLAAGGISLDRHFDVEPGPA